MAQVSRDQQQPARLLGQHGQCIFIAGEGVEVPLPGLDPGGHCGGQKAPGKAGGRFMPSPVYERGFLVRGMAQGRQKLARLQVQPGCRGRC